jgi:hypothetical protein
MDESFVELAGSGLQNVNMHPVESVTSSDVVTSTQPAG